MRFIEELIKDIQNGGEKLGELTDPFPEAMKGSMAKKYWNDPTFTYGVEYGALIILSHLLETYEEYIKQYFQEWVEEEFGDSHIPYHLHDNFDGGESFMKFLIKKSNQGGILK